MDDQGTLHQPLYWCRRKIQMARWIPNLPMCHYLASRIISQSLPNTPTRSNCHPSQEIDHLRCDGGHLNTHIHLRNLPHQLPSCHDGQKLQYSLSDLGRSAVLQSQRQKTQAWSKKDHRRSTCHHRNNLIQSLRSRRCKKRGETNINWRYPPPPRLPSRRRLPSRFPGRNQVSYQTTTNGNDGRNQQMGLDSLPNFCTSSLRSSIHIPILLRALALCLSHDRYGSLECSWTNVCIQDD